jgi:probable HAF family extracellular repeat protein
LLVLAIAVAASPTIASAQPTYTVNLLRPASPFDYEVPNGINQAGHITGYAVIDTSSEFHAFIQRGDAFQDLGLLGYGGTTGIAINGLDQVALDGETPGVVALFDANGNTHRIGGVDGGSSWVSAINENGDVVGSARNGDGNNVGFSWIGGVFTDLSTLNIYKASAINDSRQIAGSIPYYWGGGGYLHGQAHACLYSGGVVTDLGSIINDPRTDTEALGIDAAGDVVGYSTAADGSKHAFLYYGGNIQDLGTLPGDYATAIAINNSGIIIGTLSNPYGASLGSFVYASGTMYEFGSLVTSGGDGWTQWTVTGLNDVGDIVGYGVLNDTTQGFVAVPNAVTAAGPKGSRFASAILGSRPNPFRSAMAIEFTISARAATAPSRLEIFDAAGRRRAILSRGTLTAGPHSVRWDGRDQGGAAVQGGVYFARLTTLDATASWRIVNLR